MRLKFCTTFTLAIISDRNRRYDTVFLYSKQSDRYYHSRKSPKIASLYQIRENNIHLPKQITKFPYLIYSIDIYRS